MVPTVTRTPSRKPKNYVFFGKFNYYVPGAADIFILLGWLLIGAVIGNAVTAVFAILMKDPEAAMECGMLVSYPIMFIPAMMYAGIKSSRNSFNKDGVKLDSSHFSPLGAVVCAIIVVVATISASFCMDAVSSVMPQMPDALKELLESMTTGTVWINFLTVSIFAPLCEEWLCRGMVLRGLLNNKVKPVWAIILSAVFFAVIHLNPWQAVPAFVLGCLFGYVYYRTGSLKLTMLMHFANNTFALVCSHIPAFQDVESWTDVLPGRMYWIIFAACIIVVALSILSFNKIKLQRSQGNSDEAPCLFNE